MPYLLTLLLFFLLPKSPWMMTIGSPLALPLLSWRLYARSTILKLAEAWKDRVHAGAGIAFESCIRVMCFGCRKGEDAGCIVRMMDRIVAVEVAEVPSSTFSAARRRHSDSRLYSFRRTSIMLESVVVRNLGHIACTGLLTRDYIIAHFI